MNVGQEESGISLDGNLETQETEVVYANGEGDEFVDALEYSEKPPLMNGKS